MATGPPQHPEEAQADPVSSSTQRAFHSPAVDHVEQQHNYGVLEHAIHKVGVNALPMKNSKAELVPCHIAGLSLEDELRYKSNKGLPETVKEEVLKLVRSEHAAVLNEQAATRSTVQTLKGQVDRHEREHERHNREVRDLKKDLKRQIDAKDQEIRGLKKQVTNLESQVAEVRRMKERLEQAEQEVAGKDQEIKDIKEQVSNLESQVARNEAEVRIMKERLKQAKQEKMELEQRLKESQTRCKAAEDKSAAAETRERDLWHTNRQLVDLLGQVLPRQDLQLQTSPASEGASSVDSETSRDSVPTEGNNSYSDPPPPSDEDCVRPGDDSEGHGVTLLPTGALESNQDGASEGGSSVDGRCSSEVDHVDGETSRDPEPTNYHPSDHPDNIHGGILT